METPKYPLITKGIVSYQTLLQPSTQLLAGVIIIETLKVEDYT